ncbi:MAG: transposase [Pseudomonadales bacterium]|nr:transposase [Pseudomonadales bacterium]
MASQVRRIRKRFRIQRLALVGDRGMLTSARIREDLEPADLDWISALKSADIRKLVRPDRDGRAVLSPESLLDDEVAEILSPDFPGERLMVCLNPRLRDERRRKRGALLGACADLLDVIAERVRRKTLRGVAAINRQIGTVIGKHKMAKHFDITVTEDTMTYRRREDRIAEDSRLDGIYVIRTSLNAEAITNNETVAAYKCLAGVERAFRSIKQGRVRVRPIHV